MRRMFCVRINAAIAKEAAALILAVLMAASPRDAGAASLEEEFAKPPDRAKPFVFWYWLNNHITRDGITADLEAIARVGLGGVCIGNYGGFIPRGSVEFMTPEWRGLFKHAVMEADRLGLAINMLNGDGWSGSYGPWITPENSMQVLTFSETTADGPAALPEPLPRPHSNADYYQDVAVFAFQTPPAEGLPMRSLQARVTRQPGRVGIEFPSLFRPRISREPDHVEIEFPREFTARSIRLPTAISCELHVSRDGKDYHLLATIPGSPDHWGAPGAYPAASFPPAAGRYFRINFPKGSRGAGSLNLDDLELISGSRIHETAFKAGFVRGPIEEEPIAASQPDEPGTSIPLKGVVDITSHLKPDGSLSWDVPAGNWTVLRVGHTSTGVHTEHLQTPATVPGLECDKMSKAALETHFENFPGKMIAELGTLAGTDKALAYWFIESWEVGTQNWTSNFPEHFQKRRGYDPLPYLPAMTGRVIENREVSERFLFDVRRTIAELIADNYFGHLQTLSQSHGMGVYAQAYAAYDGMTGDGRAPVFDDLQCAGRVEIPMCEFWHQPSYDPTQPRGAASAAHTYGRRIADAEAFTSWGPMGAWRNHPYALKARGDLAFTDGINRFTITGGSHQPWPKVVPGAMCGEWGIFYDRNVTWWDQSRAWIEYLSRCQYLLQEGLFAADVAYAAGEGAPKHYPVGGYTPRLPAGYAHDACATEVILDRMSVEDGRIVLPGGMSYRMLVLPDTAVMTPELCARIRDLVRDGAIVLGPKPSKSPSLSGFPGCDHRVKTIADEVWADVDGTTVKQRAYGKGQIIWGKSLEEVFAEMDLKPDFEYRLGEPSTAAPGEPAPVPANDGFYSPELNFLHRTSGDTDLYFVASRSDQAVSAICTFRAGARRPEFWHPDTGRIEKCARYRVTQDNRIEIPMRFDPAGSVFVVFREAIGGRDHVVAVENDGQALDELSPAQPFELREPEPGAVELLAREAGHYELLTANGISLTAAVAAIPPALQINGPWDVQFQPDRGAPAHAVFDRLISWPQHRDAGIKYFSGTATYRNEFIIPAEMIGKSVELELDLGRVAVIASAKLNEKELGILWKPPFRVEVTGAAIPGSNTLEISVVNLWPNRMIGDERFPPDAEYDSSGALKVVPEWVLQGLPRPEPRRITFPTQKLWKKGDPLLESGLLGPVILRAAVKESISF